MGGRACARSLLEGGKGWEEGGSRLKRERTNKTGEIDDDDDYYYNNGYEHCTEGFHPDPDKVAHHQRAAPVTAAAAAMHTLARSFAETNKKEIF